MKDLTECRIKDLDDIFLATKDSQGYENALNAIKYVLFDDESIIEEPKEPNKYTYISRTNNARQKAMLLQIDDLAHIMIKYCLQSFGLRGKPFTITDAEITQNRKNIDNLEITPYEMIEQVAYLTLHEVYTAYEYLFHNKKILTDVVEYMFQERFISDIKETLDNFTGIINNNDISTEDRFTYYEAYTNIDKNFAEIKKNDPEYIK